MFSSYFYAMFTSDVLESRQNSITLKSMDPKSVELLIEFAYTAQIRITEENVQDVLPVSCILQICPVKKACCDFIQSQLDPSNCIGIKDFSEIYGCLDLSKAAEKFIFRHFLQASESEKFQTLPEDRLVDLISRDGLFVKSEDEVRFVHLFNDYLILWLSALTFLDPNISMYILHTVLRTFSKVLTKRICSKM